MIRIAIGSVVMTLVIAVSIISFCTSKNYTEEILENLESASESFTQGDFQKAEESCTQVSELWEEYCSHILFAGSFEQERDITELLSEMKVYASQQNEEFMAKNSTAKELINTFFNVQIPYIENIL